jgi:hypothetical protein
MPPYFHLFFKSVRAVNFLLSKILVVINLASTAQIFLYQRIKVLTDFTPNYLVIQYLKINWS